MTNIVRQIMTDDEDFSHRFNTYTPDENDSHKFQQINISRSILENSVLDIEKLLRELLEDRLNRKSLEYWFGTCAPE